jgi:hypothetical protein
MGATLFYYPNEWRSIIGPIKAVSGGDTKVGVNVNWEKICGCPSNLIYSTQYYTVSVTHTLHYIFADQPRVESTAMQ